MNQAATYPFSIILPVRNGGEYIKECVNSILAQTRSDFNLHILDSGSTDGTMEWLQGLTDPRISIHQAEKPLTITENWDRIKSIPRNEWMTIIGHDDLLYPDYLETMSALIAEEPEASLYQSHFNFIDARGKFMRPCKPMSARQTAKNLLDAILGNAINIYGTGYMLRSRVYDEVGGIPLYPNLLSADYVLWLKVAALAYISTSPKTCFAYRINQSTTATTKTDVYIRSLKMFIDYLLRDKDHLSPGEDRNVYATRILTFYCQRVSRRLLTAGLKDRDGVTVKRFAAETKEYARSFLDEGHFFDPGRIRDVRLAKIVDSNLFTRKLFLLLKKIHPNPLMK